MIVANVPFYSCVLRSLAFNDAGIMLISRNSHTSKRSSQVSTKTRSTPASLLFKGQATKNTTVKIMVYCLHFCLKYNKQHIIPLEDIKLQSLDDEGSKFFCQQHLLLVLRTCYCLNLFKT